MNDRAIVASVVVGLIFVTLTAPSWAALLEWVWDLQHNLIYGRRK